MPIFLPIARLSIHLPLLIGVGALVGFLSGLLGVGGGFLLTPILIIIGVPPTVAAASDSCQILAASSSGVGAHFRLGNVDLKMGSILLLGGLAGGAFGVRIIEILRATGNADFLIIVAYVVVLGGSGAYMFVESLQSLRRGQIVPRPGTGAPVAARGLLGRLPLQMQFPRSGVRHSAFVPFVLCVFVGVLAAIMGVGGGFVMVPMMVYLLRMPMRVAVGTSLFQVLFMCAGITYMQATTNHTVDLVLALLLAAGSTMGAQVGARLSRFLRGDQLKIVLASIVLVVTVKMALSAVLTPAVLIAHSEGH
jgi:uncharacterized membrane protein YfcA